MTGNEHIIQREAIELRLRTAPGAHSYQERVARLCESQLHPRLEALFDRLAGPDNLVVLDRLVLNLGRIRTGRLEQDWTDRVLKAAEQQLAALFAALTGETTLREKEARVDQMPASRRRMDLLLFFLDQGYLPWWGSGKELEALLAGLPAFLAAAPEEAIRLIPPLQSSAPARRRLIAGLPPTHLKEIGSLLFPASFRALASLPDLIWEALEAAAPDLPARPALRHTLWERWLALVWPAEPASESQREEMRAALQKWLKAAGTAILDWLQEEAALPEAEVRERWQKMTEHLEREQGSRAPAGLISAWKDLQRAVVVSAAGAKEKEEMEGEEPVRQEPEPTLPEPIYVDNAGLVIFHPFLTYLFADAGLTREDSFVSDAARQQAVYLLQYLADGERTEAPPEYELALNKVLCGYPPAAPVEAFNRPTTAMYDEADQLLAAVLEHWEVMAQLSVEGLRSLFLDRPGKLTGESSGFLLQVDQQAQDVLMDKMPWGIGVIHLPWMPGLLRVEWT